MQKHNTTASPFGRRRSKRFSFASVHGFIVLTLLSVCGFGLSGVGDTLSYYNDFETSVDNLLAAGELDITANTTIEIDPEISCGQMKDFEIEVATTSDSFPLSHDVHVESGDDTGGLCAAMKVDAQFEGDTLVTESPLLSLLAGPVTQAGTWRFIVSLAADAASVPAGATCTAMFVFRSWPQGTVPEEDGYTDTEIVPITFTKGPGSCGENPGEPCDPTCEVCGDTTIIIKNENNATVVNSASSSANTGGNSANGGGNITTGNASSSVQIINNINQNNTTVTNSGTTSTSTSQQIKDKVNDKIKDAFSKLPKI